MPKGLNLKGFGRRKSSGNILDLPSPDEPSSTAAPSSTFRVIERQDKKGVTYGAAADRNASRPLNSPIHALRGKSENDLSKGSSRPRVAGWPQTGATRGSGGTTNSGSSGYYDSSSASARHSSTSTLPSSVDPDRHPEEEELYAPRAPAAPGMYQTVSAGMEDLAPLPQPPSFSSRAARAFSFGNRKNSGRPSTDTKDVPPVPPVHQSDGESTRERAMTTSSYASTAVPSKPELNFGNDFGGDFGSSMFDSLQKEAPPPPLPIAGSFHRTESEPMYPARTLSRDTLSNSPSPNPLQLNRENTASPYSYDEPNSAGFSSSSALSSPDPSTLTHGPVDGIAQAFLGNSQTGYARVPDRYASPVHESPSSENFPAAGYMANNGKARQQEYPNRQTHVDDDDRWVKKVELRDPQASTTSNRLAPSSSRGNNSYGQSSASSSRIRAASPGSSAGGSWAGADSITTTPRANGRAGVTLEEPSMFDSSPSGPASRAIRPAVQSKHTDGTPKKMTKAQFQALQQKRDEGSTEQSEEEDVDSGDEYDDEDDVERAKRLAAQRRQQEATMSVYRQQMKKVTGGGPTDLPSSGATGRPTNDRSASSASGFYFGGISGTPPTETVRGNQNGDDEDVPLGILQAHGFPGANRPPMMGENDLHQRRASMAGSAMGGASGGGNLPAFARKLPADPYYGAGLVNQSTRESLAMNGTGSVYGMPTGPQPQQSMGHPGGLVGVIAGEEKARAARRGNPNTAAGTFSTMGNMPVNAAPPPQMGRAMSMGNLAPPSVYTPTGLPPMPMMPQMGMLQMGQMPMTPGMDPQMQQFMQMQMQMMQNMINMQQAQMGQPNQPPQDNGFLGPNRPMSMASQQSYNGPPQNQGRSMTMMNPPAGWNRNHSPSQSRPASAMPPMGTYAPSMNGLNVNGGGPGPGYSPSIAPSERSNIGMPSRYRPVTQNGDAPGRTQSMTSSLTLQAFTNQQSAPNPGTPFNGTQVQAPKSTIRVVDKPKGSPRMTSARPGADDEDESWGDLKKNRETKKKSRFTFGRGKKDSTSQEAPLSDLYPNMD